MPRLFLGFVFALTAGALLPMPANANTSTHNFGPHTKAQIVALCAHAHGAMTVSTGKWECKTARWEIACINSGRNCTIDLLGAGTPADGPRGSGDNATPGAPGPAPAGGGLSGNGGVGAVGGQIGGGHIGGQMG
jgi:hypothetical protein